MENCPSMETDQEGLFSLGWPPSSQCPQTFWSLKMKTRNCRIDSQRRVKESESDLEEMMKIGNESRKEREEDKMINSLEARVVDMEEQLKASKEKVKISSESVTKWNKKKKWEEQQKDKKGEPEDRIKELEKKVAVGGKMMQSECGKSFKEIVEKWLEE